MRTSGSGPPRPSGDSARTADTPADRAALFYTAPPAGLICRCRMVKGIRFGACRMIRGADVRRSAAWPKRLLELIIEDAEMDQEKWQRWSDLLAERDRTLAIHGSHSIGCCRTVVSIAPISGESTTCLATKGVRSSTSLDGKLGCNQIDLARVIDQPAIIGLTAPWSDTSAKLDELWRGETNRGFPTAAQ